MSDTHAQTAKAQADVMTGDPNVPPGHLEHENRPDRPSGTRDRSLLPWFAAAGLAIVVVLIAIAYLG